MISTEASLNSAVLAQTNAAVAAETDISGRLAAEVSRSAGSLVAETQRAQLVEASLSLSLSSEASRALSAEATETFRALSQESAEKELVEYNVSSLAGRINLLSATLFNTMALGDTTSANVTARISLIQTRARVSIDNLDQVWTMSIVNTTNCCGTQKITICASGLLSNSLQMKISLFVSQPSLFQPTTTTTAKYNVSRVSRVDFRNGNQTGCLDLTVYLSQTRSTGLSRRGVVNATTGLDQAYDSVVYSVVHKDSASWGVYTPTSPYGSDLQALQAAASAALLTSTTSIDPLLIVVLIALAIHAIWLLAFSRESRQRNIIYSVGALSEKEQMQEIRNKIDELHRRPSFIARQRKREAAERRSQRSLRSLREKAQVVNPEPAPLPADDLPTDAPTDSGETHTASKPAPSVSLTGRSDPQGAASSNASSRAAPTSSVVVVSPTPTSNAWATKTGPQETKGNYYDYVPQRKLSRAELPYDSAAGQYEEELQFYQGEQEDFDDTLEFASG